MAQTGTPTSELLLGRASIEVADAAGRVDELDADGLGALVVEVRSLRAGLDRLSLAITRRSDALHREGAAGRPEDLWSGAADAGGDAGGGSGTGTGGRGPAPDPGEGRRQRRRWELCQQLRAVAAAFDADRIDAGHLDVLTRLWHGLDTAMRDAVRGLDAELAAQAAQLDPSRFEAWCRARLSALGGELGRRRHEQQLRDTRLRRWVDPEGMVHLHGRFHPELGQRISTALDAQIDHLHQQRTSGGEHPDGPADSCGPVLDQWHQRDHLAAHALAQLVLGAHRSLRPGTTEICVLTDVRTLLEGWHDDSLCETHDGTPLPAATLHRLACLAELRRVLLAPDGEVLDLGRTTRLANRAQRRALRARYRTCAWPGCRTPFDWCQIHHLRPWDPDGLTDLHNLLPLCTTHHHHAHELGWGLTLHSDRSLTITRPDGTPFVTTPPPTLSPTRACSPADACSGTPPGRPPPGDDTS